MKKDKICVLIFIIVFTLGIVITFTYKAHLIKQGNKNIIATDLVSNETTISEFLNTTVENSILEESSNLNTTIAVTTTTMTTIPTTTTTTKLYTTTTPITKTTKNVTTITTTTAVSYNSNEKLTQLQNEIYGYAVEICAKYPNVKPSMVMAIIQYESNFNKYAVNYNGTCYGLMQIYVYYNQDRINKLGVTDIYDPYSNILVGVDLLDYLYRYYSNWEDALYHYSGGISSYYGLIMNTMPKYNF